MPPRVCNRRYHPTDDRPAAPERGPTAQAPAGPSPRSLHALDWFFFFLADVLTGFGPFVAVYLASQRKPARCQRSRVAGVMIFRASSIPGASR